MAKINFFWVKVAFAISCVIVMLALLVSPTPTQTPNTAKYANVRLSITSYDEVIEKLKARDFRITESAESFLSERSYSGSQQEECQVALVSNADLGLNGDNCALFETYAAAHRLGLRPCPYWVALQLVIDGVELPYDDVIVAVDPFCDLHHNPAVLYTGWNKGWFLDTYEWGNVCTL
ncbi:MAG: hypothetical protein WCX71_05765, partial [Candidatus Buchananbacteria bacterium]